MKRRQFLKLAAWSPLIALFPSVLINIFKGKKGNGSPPLWQVGDIVDLETSIGYKGLVKIDHISSDNCICFSGISDGTKGSFTLGTYKATSLIKRT